MSTIAEQSAARRAKILARSKTRMATVTGGMMSSEIPSESPPPPSSLSDSTRSTEATPLSHEKAAAELEKAIEELFAQTEKKAMTPISNDTATSTSSTHSTSSSASTSAAPLIVDDPHEFLSAADAREFTPPSSPTRSDSSLQSLEMSTANGIPSFASGFAALAAARKRKQENEMLADLPTAPTASPLTAWKRRVTSQAKKVAPIRAVTHVLIAAVGICAGLGWIEGGLMFLVMIEIMAVSIEQISSFTSNKNKTPSSASSSTRPASAASSSVPPPPPPSSTDDPDVIDLDTDQYRQSNATSAAAAAAATDPFSALMMQPGMNGILPPGMDSSLQALQVLMKYAAVMKQLMHDGMVFIFTCVTVGAVAQLMTGDERVQYE